VVHLGQSRPAPGGRQLAGQAANLTFESACRLLEAEHSPIAKYVNISYRFNGAAGNFTGYTSIVF